jgi:hypothetical protein
MNEKQEEIVLDTLKDFLTLGDDRPVKVVYIPEWNMSVRLRGMSFADRIAFSTTMPRKPGKTPDAEPEVDFLKYKVHMLLFSIVNKDGKPLFTPGDAAVLENKSVTAIDRLYEVAEQLNGMGEAEKKAMEKNSGAPQNAG